MLSNYEFINWETYCLIFAIPWCLAYVVSTNVWPKDCVGHTIKLYANCTLETSEGDDDIKRLKNIKGHTTNVALSREQDELVKDCWEREKLEVNS